MENLLNEILEGINGISNRLDKVENEIKEMKSDFSGSLASLEKQATKNSVLLEKVDSNVKLLAEGQEAFREQMGRINEQDTRTVTDRLETIEIAVTNTSKSLSYLAGTVDVVKNTTATNDIEIKILKRLQNNPSM